MTHRFFSRNHTEKNIILLLEQWLSSTENISSNNFEIYSLQILEKFNIMHLEEEFLLFTGILQNLMGSKQTKF